MSVIEYKYQPCTHESLLDCIRWCQNQFQLRDWEIDFSDDTPQKQMMVEYDGQEYGRASIAGEVLKAYIWINHTDLKNDGLNPYSSVIHEMFHVMQVARGTEVEEITCRIVEPLLYRLYCRENKIKIAGEK